MRVTALNFWVISTVFQTVITFSECGIAVNIIFVPIIPSINSHEILPLAKAASENGALGFLSQLLG